MTSRQRRRLPLEHVLIAACSQDIDAARALVALLPQSAYGQVFVVADKDSAVEIASSLHTPSRVTVTCVEEDAQLSVAAAAWTSEWIPDEPTTDRLVSMWLSERISDAVEPTCHALVCSVERL